MQPLSVRDFRLLWLGQGVSLFGDQFYLVALPWLTLQLTGSGLALGTVLVLSGGSRAIFQLLGGAVTDRVAARTLMVVSNVLRALATAAITALVVTGVVELWHLYILSIIFGVLDAFFVPAYLSVVPMLIVEEHLAAGNALIRSTNRFMSLIGPAIAGLVVSHQSLGAAFGVDAATFVFAAVAIGLMKERRRPGADQDSLEGERPLRLKGLLASIGEGLRYAWEHPLARALLFFIAAFEFSIVGPFFVGLPAMTKMRFETGASALGWMLSAFGGGMLAGMLLAGSIKMRRRGLLIISMSFLSGAGVVLLGFAAHVAWASVILAIVGAGAGLTNILILALLHSETDRRLLGRVMGLLMFGSILMESLSYAVAGVMADANLTALFVISGAVVLVTSVLTLGGRTLRATK
ncbi:MAG TPA: MFS transporter [Blastocatellia bacterium]|nr:MFS transporter [Blastocatellia bacterium]